MKNRFSQATLNSFNLVWSFAKVHKNLFFIYIFASIGNASADILTGYYIKYITDITLSGRRQEINRIGLYLIIIVVSGFFIKYLSGISSGRFSLYIVRDLRNHMSHHLGSLPVSYLEKGHSGKIVTKLTGDINAIQNFLQSTLLVSLYNIIIFIAAFIYLLTINWKLTLIAVSLTPLTMLLVNLLSRPISKYVKSEMEGYEAVTAIAQDSVGGTFIEKAYNLHEFMQTKYDQAVNNALSFALKRERRASFIYPLNIILRWIPLITTAICGGYMSFRGQISTGSLFAFVYLLNYLVDPLSNFPTLLNDSKVALVSFERVGGVLIQEEEFTSGKPFESRDPDNVISFRNVSFSYTDRTEVISTLSFDLPANKSFALVGSSGSGKSTVFKLICGFYRPDSGSILLNGNELGSLDMDEARMQFSLVSQDTYLFPVSVGENISYGKPEASMDEVIEAAKMANAHQFITELPEGYNTLVGERGIRLSGGQKQRISIARAILKNAPILLLDEATAALDMQSENYIQEALERFTKDKTVLIIAHRLSTIKNVDEILVLDGGKVVERGSHEELMSAEGIYSQLYTTQCQSGEIS